MTLPLQPATAVSTVPPEAAWSAVADEATAWAAAHSLPLRDVVVLVPFVQLLAPARRAFARRGVWMPRIETTRTLAAALGPPPRPEPQAPSGDELVDEWAARSMLQQRRADFADGIDLDAAAADVATLAAAIQRTLRAAPPAARAERVARTRTLFGADGGPGGDERLLARIALDWAASGGAAPTDALWSLRPAALVAVRAGGADALTDAITDALLDAGAAPTLVIDLDADGAGNIERDASHAAIVACADFEHEAQDSAAEVIDALARGPRPVALIAHDRTTTRRIRALLEGRAVSIADETGWRLSTTRAAATLAVLLDAAPPDSAADTTFDALKSLAAWSDALAPAAIEGLEAHCRRGRITRRAALDAATLPERLQPARAALRAWLAPLGAMTHAPLPAWLDALRAALEAAGAWGAWSADPAGQAVVDAIGLDPERGRGRALRERVTALPIDVDTLRRWIERSVDAASYVPLAPADPDVVILPLARALLRPFGAVVFPGADDRRLGIAPAPWPLIGEAAATSIGLPNSARRLAAVELAFGHLLRVPRITWLHRCQEGTESIGPSAWVQRALAQGAVPRGGKRMLRAIAPAPIGPGAPRADRLPRPARISATAAEALRDCPYRYFALRLLALRESDELDDRVEPRDFGRWMHDVLLRFHLERPAPRDAAADIAVLRAIATSERDRTGLPAAAFVPYEAAFVAFAPRYVDLLHARDAQGWRFQDGEREVEIRPAELDPTTMFGKIDRIDVGPEGTELIDYKTGSTDTVRTRVREPFEDTQLAFYAALIAAEVDGDLHARYLPLEGSKALEPIEHKQVARSAAALVQGLGGELARIAAGAPLRPLGEAEACDFCAARGLCRRDHWSLAP